MKQYSRVYAEIDLDAMDMDTGQCPLRKCSKASPMFGDMRLPV